jgi:hypothetical protein
MTTSDLPMLRVGAWWIVQGRHGHGFHRFDALNMSAAEAQAQARRLLPTITDEQVQAMHHLMQERHGNL